MNASPLSPRTRSAKAAMMRVPFNRPQPGCCPDSDTHADERGNLAGSSLFNLRSLPELPAMKALQTFANFIRLSDGATAIEYAFVASLISIAIYAAAVTIGGDLSGVFSSVATKL
jgi:pilus assembly protein Flp/PilA